MTIALPPICTGCKHLDDEEMTCTAFPDGIPEDIIMSRVDHREPVDGDHGVRFEQDPRLAVPMFDTLFPIRQ